MFKRILCCLCCVLMAVLPAVSVAESAFVMAGFDGEDSAHDWNTNRFFTRMQERTGVSFTFQQYIKRADWETAKQAMFAPGGQLPDVLFKAELSSDELIRYTQSGQLVDLKPLLEENAPNLWALLQANPAWLQAITLPNGMIGALPTIQEIGPQNGMWINQAWLNKLKLSVPEDMQSLREVLTAFRDRDPNANGKKDEIPMAFLGPWELKFFSHAWGVVANDYNIYLDESGAVQFWPLDDRFIEMARTLRDFYAEGLLDPDGFVTGDTLRRIADDDAAQVYGAMFAPTPVNVVTYNMAEDFVIMEPFACEGKKIYRDLFGQITRGTFAITSACKDPAALLRWVDVLYTPEGAVEAMVGIEGEDYVYKADGFWDWKGGIGNMDMNMLNEMTVYDTGNMPWLFPRTFYNQYADESVRRINAEMERSAQYTVQPYPTCYTLTAEEKEKVASLQSALGMYVDETLARFVLGELEINDETVTAFREELVKLGCEEMIAFWQNKAQELAK